MKYRFELLRERACHQGFLRLDHFHLRHERYDGSWTGSLSRECLRRGAAVAVLPYDPRSQRVLLIEQFRIGALLAGEAPWQVEVVAGLVEDGESECDVARRELLEECGCTAQSLEFIARTMSSAGSSNETVAIYCAEVDIDPERPPSLHGVVGEGEDIRCFATTPQEAWAMVADGRIMAAQAIIALQWLQQHLQMPS